jgi:hypothetical protein
MGGPLEAVVFLVLAAISVGAAVVVGERQPGHSSRHGSRRPYRFAVDLQFD